MIGALGAVTSFWGPLAFNFLRSSSTCCLVALGVSFDFHFPPAAKVYVCGVRARADVCECDAQMFQFNLSNYKLRFNIPHSCTFSRTTVGPPHCQACEHTDTQLPALSLINIQCSARHATLIPCRAPLSIPGRAPLLLYTTTTEWNGMLVLCLERNGTLRHTTGFATSGEWHTHGMGRCALHDQVLAWIVLGPWRIFTCGTGTRQ